MTKDEKIQRKLRRVEKRRNKRRKDFRNIDEYMTQYGLSFTQARSCCQRGYFKEYGKLIQICSYMGLCEYPCNGDC